MHIFRLYFFFFFYFTFTYSEMIITWGKLSTCTGCQIIYSGGDCFDICMQNDSCIIAQASVESCYHCESDFSYQIQSLAQENANGTKIGLKAANLTTCPDSPNITFYYGDCTMVYSEGYWQVVNPTTTTNNPTTTTIKRGNCQSGWIKSIRAMGNWCYKVAAGTMNYTDAQAACETLNATLSGMETVTERSYIINKGLGFLQDVGYEQGSVWVGAQRVTACKLENENATECVPWANNAYDWTDGFTSGKDMMTWIPDQPDYSQQAESCVQMAIVLTQTDNGAKSGQLNDVVCSISTAPIDLNVIRGYACGKEADIFV